MFKIRTHTLPCDGPNDLAVINCETVGYCSYTIVHWHLVLVGGQGVSHGPQVGSVTDGLHTHLHILECIPPCVSNS